MKRQHWQGWGNLVIGLWVIVSPWMLGFNTSTALMWNAVVMGVLVIVFAGWILAEGQRPTQLAK